MHAITKNLHVLAVQESAEHMYLVMEFCDGGDLSKFIAKNKPLKEPMVKNFAQQIGICLGKDAKCFRLCCPDVSGAVARWQAS